MKKRILIAITHPPYGNSLGREAIEAALASAVFEQDISVLFSGDGVLHLLQNQQPSVQKNLSAMINAFEIYGLEKIYIDQQALASRSITPDELIVDAEIVDSPKLSILHTEQDHILSF